MTQCTPTNRIGSLLPGHLGEVDSLINHFFAPGQSVRSTLTNWRVPATIWEADEKFHVELDAPGVLPEDVGVTFESGQLVLELERKSPVTETEETTYTYNERRFGKVRFAFDLPETVDPDSIEANLTNGVLRVSIAKLPEAQPRKIEVRNG